MKWTSLLKLGLGLGGAAGGGLLIGKLSDQRKLNIERAALNKANDVIGGQQKLNLQLKEQTVHLTIELKKERIARILDTLIHSDLKESLRNVGNLFLALLEKKYIQKIELTEKESNFVALFDKMLTSENIKKRDLDFVIEFAKEKLK